MGNIEVEMPSNKKFGLFFCFVFGSVAICLWYLDFLFFMYVSGLLSCILLGFAICRPDKLALYNRLWFRIGILIGTVISPIVLGMIFFLVISPLAVGMRIFGRDELLIRGKSKNFSSFWINRDPAGPMPESFKNQF